VDAAKTHGGPKEKASASLTLSALGLVALAGLDADLEDGVRPGGVLGGAPLRRRGKRNTDQPSRSPRGRRLRTRMPLQTWLKETATLVAHELTSSFQECTAVLPNTTSPPLRPVDTAEGRGGWPPSPRWRGCCCRTRSAPSSPRTGGPAAALPSWHNHPGPPIHFLRPPSPTRRLGKQRRSVPNPDIKNLVREREHGKRRFIFSCVLSTG